MNGLEVIVKLCEVCRALANIVQDLAASAAQEDAVRQSGIFREAADTYRQITGEELIDAPLGGVANGEKADG